MNVSWEVAVTTRARGEHQFTAAKAKTSADGLQGLIVSERLAVLTLIP